MPSHRLPPRKLLLSAFFVFHFTVLLLNNLPWSPFIAPLYPKYSWYPRLTGQIQDWGMYTHPDHQRSLIRLTAHFDDERVEHPWGVMSRMGSRRLYFLEGLFVRENREDIADRFLRHVMNGYPEHDRPNRVELVIDSWPTYGFDVLKIAEPADPTQRKRVVHR